MGSFGNLVYEEFAVCVCVCEGERGSWICLKRDIYIALAEGQPILKPPRLRDLLPNGETAAIVINMLSFRFKGILLFLGFSSVCSA
jgi:hypothetical protein